MTPPSPFSFQSQLPSQAPKEPHMSRMKNNPLLSQAKPTFQVSRNSSPCTGLFSSGYECLHHMPIWEYLTYANFSGSPHRYLGHHHTFSPAFTRVWTVPNSNLLYAETADAKCNPRTLMFHEDAVYATARTCSRELGFVSVSPCQSHVLFHVFLQFSFLSHFQKGQDTSPNLAVNSPMRNAPVFFYKSGTTCWGQVESAISGISSWLFHVVGLQWKSCHVEKDLTGRSNSG